MADLSSELARFHEFIGQYLSYGKGDLTPEEALDIWRTEHPLREGFEETVESLREALEDMAAGDVGIPAEQFFRVFREAHGLPPRRVSAVLDSRSSDGAI